MEMVKQVVTEHSIRYKHRFQIHPNMLGKNLQRTENSEIFQRWKKKVSGGGSSHIV